MMTEQEARVLAEMAQDPDILRQAIEAQTRLLEETRTLPTGPEANRWILITAARRWLEVMEAGADREIAEIASIIRWG